MLTEEQKKNGVDGGEFCAACPVFPGKEAGCCHYEDLNFASRGWAPPEGITKPKAHTGSCEWWDQGCVLPCEARPPICRFYFCSDLGKHLGLISKDFSFLSHEVKRQEMLAKYGEYAWLRPEWPYEEWGHLNTPQGMRDLCSSSSFSERLLNVPDEVLMPGHPVWKGMDSDYCKLHIKDLKELRQILIENGGKL